MKRITEKEIADWATRGESEGDLPILIRRLIHSTIESPEKIEFPGGDSVVDSPGFDGVVVVDTHNEWVPEGESNWEVSRRKDCKRKADEDYQTRTDETPAEKRQAATFMFVTPRRWRAKKKWEQGKCAEGKWKNVRALDAVDLEQWIEKSQSVQVWMTKKLGRTFPGCITREQAWEEWATVTKPHLSPNLVLAGRQGTVNNLTGWLSKPPCYPFHVIADSRGEAIAFVCAVLAECKKYADKLIVVKGNQDEAYELLNAQKTTQPILLFTEESDAVFALSRKVHVIIADAKGGQGESGEQPGLLRRISRESFVKAVVGMDCKEKEAEKLSRESGCSVPILRRLLAPVDSSIAKPDWAKNENTQVIIAAALVGRWNGESEYDRDFLAYLAKMDYEKFEMQIVKFLHEDDAPLEKKNDIWSVKSRIDSLFGVAEFIPSTVMGRFWEKAEEIFGIRNPALDVPKEMRFAARSIYKKSPPYSGALLSSIADTLILLSVYHERLICCKNIETSVFVLVRKILDKAEKDRWLSLSGILRKLAEAAPDAFLGAIDKGLESDNTAVSGLFSADNHSMFVPNYHVELLWGLEILAWDSKHLPRVINILAHMVNFQLPVNMANRPDNSLLSFFRAWFPQCGADINERILRFKQLCKHHPEAAWKICPQLLNVRWDHAIHNPTPRWREIPVHAEHKAELAEEYAKMLDAVFENVLLLINENVDRIIQILDIFTSLVSVEKTKRFIETVKSSMAAADEEARARVRDKVCEKIGLCRLWRSSNTPPVDSKWLEKILPMYLDLQKEIQPKDLVLRHMRIFTDSFRQNLEFHENDHQKRQDRLWKNRKEVIHEILKSNEGKGGVIRLAARCNDAWLVGRAVVVKDDKARMLWAHLACQSDMDEFRKTNFMRGIFADMSEWGKFAMSGFTQMNAEKWGEENIVSFALALRPCGKIWDALESSCSEKIQTKYWRNFKYNIVEEEDVPRLVAETARRSCYDIALHHATSHRFNTIEADSVIRILEKILTLPDDEKNKIGYQYGYQIGLALSYSAKMGIEKSVIARLEWAFYTCLENVDYKPNAIRFLLADNPEFFIQAIRNMSNADVGHRWWNVLGDWNIPPGMTASGEFDDKKLRAWIAEARNLARQFECLKLADTEIGRILAHTPEGKDGIRPCEAVRNFLEEENDVDKIASGLQASICSPRRIKTMLGDVGEQERNQAIKYQETAERLHLHYPRTARIYRELADQCLRSAKWHDQMAKPEDPEWDD